MDRTENDLRKSFSRYTTNFRIQKENATSSFQSWDQTVDIRFVPSAVLDSQRTSGACAVCFLRSIKDADQFVIPSVFKLVSERSQKFLDFEKICSQTHAHSTHLAD
jgi:hypothetical protein